MLILSFGGCANLWREFLETYCCISKKKKGGKKNFSHPPPPPPPLTRGEREGLKFKFCDLAVSCSNKVIAQLNYQETNFFYILYVKGRKGSQYLGSCNINW